MAWRCKRCGTEVIQKKTEENLLDKNKNPYDKKEISLISCPWCHSWADEVEDIANWEEE